MGRLLDLTKQGIERVHHIAQNTRYSRDLIEWKQRIRRLSLIHGDNYLYKPEKRKDTKPDSVNNNLVYEEEPRETGWFNH